MTDKLRILQLCELEILNVFVRICEKCNLKYFLIGGTLLGAVRHKGFIPRDDDIDVIMPRRDYNRFAEIAPKMLGKKYFYQSPQTDLHYRMTYAKIRMNGTEIFEDRFKNPKFNSGVFIDIFPLDKCPRPGVVCHFLFNVMAVMNYKSQVDSGADYGPYDEISGKIGYAILKLFSPGQLIKLRRILLDFSKKLSSGRYVASFAGAYGYRKEIYPAAWFGNAVVEFEGRKYNAPSGYKKILRRAYGDDYMIISDLIPKRCHIDLQKSNLGG